MKDTFDPTADAAYIYLSDEPVGYTREIDEDRLVDFTSAGEPSGVEFLAASYGVRVTGLPAAASLLAYRLRQLGLPVLDETVRVAGSQVSLAPVFTRGVSARTEYGGTALQVQIVPDFKPTSVAPIRPTSDLRTQGHLIPPQFSTSGTGRQ